MKTYMSTRKIHLKELNKKYDRDKNVFKKFST